MVEIILTGYWFQHEHTMYKSCTEIHRGKTYMVGHQDFTGKNIQICAGWYSSLVSYPNFSIGDAEYTHINLMDNLRHDLSITLSPQHMFCLLKN